VGDGAIAFALGDICKQVHLSHFLKWYIDKELKFVIIYFTMKKRRCQKFGSSKNRRLDEALL
jgi:hypothetical protein